MVQHGLNGLTQWILQRPLSEEKRIQPRSELQEPRGLRVERKRVGQVGRGHRGCVVGESLVGMGPPKKVRAAGVRQERSTGRGRLRRVAHSRATDEEI